MSTALTMHPWLQWSGFQWYEAQKKNNTQKKYILLIKNVNIIIKYEYLNLFSAQDRLYTNSSSSIAQGSFNCLISRKHPRNSTNVVRPTNSRTTTETYRKWRKRSSEQCRK
jgi:hypothetical protein